MFKPFDLLGSAAEPPGNVTVNVAPGATLSGALMPTVTSCVCVRCVVPSTASHCTPGKVCTTVCALADDVSAAVVIPTAMIDRPA